jgi:UDP-3-O-[3-hydroxymyristoyl] glucosamine N-acyltransferase
VPKDCTRLPPCVFLAKVADDAEDTMKLGEIAEHLGCELRGDPGTEIHAVAPIEEAAPGTLTFVANPRYRPHLQTTRASAVIVALTESDVSLPCLRAADPYLAFAQALELFYVPPPLPSGVHPSAVISPSARIGHAAAVGPFCVVGEEAVVGDGARLDAHVVIYPQARIGDGFRAYAHVVVRERVVIGDRVTLHSGCVIGGDGFGYVIGADGNARKIVQAGTVIIENDVEIGANTTVDRAAVGATVIRRGAKLDNLVMVAHGCSIGEGSALAAQVGLSGSTRVGRLVRIGGQAGAAGHLSIGDGAQVAAQSGVPHDVPAGGIVGGYPAVDIHLWRRISAASTRLPDLLRRVRQIENALALRKGSPPHQGEVRGGSKHRGRSTFPLPPPSKGGGSGHRSATRQRRGSPKRKSP